MDCRVRKKKREREIRFGGFESVCKKKRFGSLFCNVFFGIYCNDHWINKLYVCIRSHQIAYVFGGSLTFWTIWNCGGVKVPKPNPTHGSFSSVDDV